MSYSSSEFLKDLSERESDISHLFHIAYSTVIVMKERVPVRLDCTWLAYTILTDIFQRTEKTINEVGLKEIETY